jgi:hypothetical protein
MLQLINARVPGGSRPPGTAAVIAGCLLVAVLGGVTASARVTSASAYRAAPMHILYEHTLATDRIAQAEHRLITDCMAKHGHTYTGAAPVTDQNPDRPTPFGYETLPDGTTSTDPPAEQPASQALGYERALLGDPAQRLVAEVGGMRVSGPAGGCIAEAKQRLLPNQREQWMRLQIQLYQAQDRAVRSLAEDARFRAATEQWRTCVRGYGFTWKNPVEAQLALPVGADARTYPGTLVDLHCKERTGYLATAYARLADAQRRELGPTPNMLTEWQNLLRDQDEIAAALGG